jgi:hypothetical protein
MTTPIKKGRWQATPKTTDTPDSTAFAWRCKVMPLALATYDAALIALLFVIVWGLV